MIIIGVYLIYIFFTFCFYFILILFLEKSCRYNFRDWTRGIYYESELSLDRKNFCQLNYVALCVSTSFDDLITLYYFKFVIMILFYIYMLVCLFSKLLLCYYCYFFILISLF